MKTAKDEKKSGRKIEGNPGKRRIIGLALHVLFDNLANFTLLNVLNNFTDFTFDFQIVTHLHEKFSSNTHFLISFSWKMNFDVLEISSFGPIANDKQLIRLTSRESLSLVLLSHRSECMRDMTGKFGRIFYGLDRNSLSLSHTLQQTQFAPCRLFVILPLCIHLLLPVGDVFCYRLPTHMSLVAFHCDDAYSYEKTILSIYIRIMIYQCHGTTKALTNSIHCFILTFIPVIVCYAASHTYRHGFCRI